jgi:hypothetical protein
VEVVFVRVERALCPRRELSFNEELRHVFRRNPSVSDSDPYPARENIAGKGLVGLSAQIETV